MIDTRKLTMACAGLVLCLAVAAAAQVKNVETQIAVRDLPHAVLSAFQHEYPEAQIKGVTKAADGTEVYYRIESLDGKTARSVQYEADGSVVEIAETVPPQSLPDGVKATMEERCPGGAVLLAREVTKGADVTYVLRLACGELKVNMVLDPSGNLVVERRSGGKRDSGKDSDQD